MLRTLRQLTRNRALERTVAKVLAVDELAVTADVELDGGTALYGVPLRVLNSSGDAGIYAYPAVGSYVELEFVGGSAAQPRVAKVQDFDRLVVRKPDGFTLEMTRDGKLLAGPKDGPTHPVPLGDELLTRIETLESAHNSHTHGGVQPGAGSTGGPSATVDGAPEFNSEQVYINE